MPKKSLMAEDGQRTPHHYHIVKTEDIVNRGGARFVVELFKVDRAGSPLKERFRVLKDVKTLDLGPGDRVTLEPGESLVLEPFVAHAFWAEGGTTLAGEVSLANDDATDNYFLPPPEAAGADRGRPTQALRHHARPRAAGRAAGVGQAATSWNRLQCHSRESGIQRRRAVRRKVGSPPSRR